MCDPMPAMPGPFDGGDKSLSKKPVVKLTNPKAKPARIIQRVRHKANRSQSKRSQPSSRASSTVPNSAQEQLEQLAQEKSLVEQEPDLGQLSNFDLPNPYTEVQDPYVDPGTFGYAIPPIGDEIIDYQDDIGKNQKFVFQGPSGDSYPDPQYASNQLAIPAPKPAPIPMMQDSFMSNTMQDDSQNSFGTHFQGSMYDDSFSFAHQDAQQQASQHQASQLESSFNSFESHDPRLFESNENFELQSPTSALSFDLPAKVSPLQSFSTTSSSGSDPQSEVRSNTIAALRQTLQNAQSNENQLTMSQLNQISELINASTQRTAGQVANDIYGDKFKGDTAFCRKLANEPVVRSSIQRRPDQVLKMTRRSNAEAFLAYVSGTRTVRACRNCQKGHGPWKECVIIEGQLYGSCTNCWYNASGVRCTFHTNNRPEASYAPNQGAPSSSFQEVPSGSQEMPAVPQQQGIIGQPQYQQQIVTTPQQQIVTPQQQITTPQLQIGTPQQQGADHMVSVVREKRPATEQKKQQPIVSDERVMPQASPSVSPNMAQRVVTLVSANSQGSQEMPQPQSPPVRVYTGYDFSQWKVSDRGQEIMDLCRGQPERVAIFSHLTTHIDDAFQVLDARIRDYDNYMNSIEEAMRPAPSDGPATLPPSPQGSDEHSSDSDS